MEEISAPLPLIQKKYSLDPDMIFGWRPKHIKSGPIPLDFSLNPLPTCKDSPDQKFPIIYYGYRPQNSHIMHKCFSTTSSYNYLFQSHLEKFMDIPKRQLQPNEKHLSGMKHEYLNEIEFDSFFECGNLDKVVRISKNEYDLYIRSDSNTYGNYKWFNFKVQNKCEERTVKFNIVNFKEKHSLFTQGQKPMIKLNNNSWQVLSGNVSYKLSKLNRNIKKGAYYQLSFEQQLKPDDSYHIATTIPYTLSDLHIFLDTLSNQYSISSIGKSLSGLAIPLLTLTNSASSNQNKRIIIIQARQHPSETVSSILVQNCISFLVSNQKVSNKLLSKFIFKVIPMVNVDGVVIGNSRMSFAGDDLNRKFAGPDAMLHPEVIAIKKLVEECKQQNGIFMFIDLHGHSKKKGSFMYGPYFPLHSNTYFNIRLLPKYIAQRTQIFRYYSCRFKSEKALRQSARLVMSLDFNIKYTYTMENSLYGYVDDNRNTAAFKQDDYKMLAKALIESIYKFSKFISSKNRKEYKKSKYENSFSEIAEEERKNISSSESDSQSSSEEECIEAKKKVIMAIKKYEKRASRKETSANISNIKVRPTKRIKSQNQLANIRKNLPDLAKKQAITNKINHYERFLDRSAYQSSVNVGSKLISLNETRLEVSPTIENTSINSVQKQHIPTQKHNASKINVFEMFTNRKASVIADNSQSRFKRNFNFPAFFAKPLKNS